MDEVVQGPSIEQRSSQSVEVQQGVELLTLQNISTPGCYSGREPGTLAQNGGHYKDKPSRLRRASK